MSRTREDIELQIGGTFDRELPISGPDGQPIDLTQYTIAMQVRDVAAAAGAATLLDLSTAKGDGSVTLVSPNGPARFTATPAATGQITARAGVYDVKVTDPTGAVDYPYYGGVTLLPRVTT